MARPVLDAPADGGGPAIAIRRATESDLPAIVEIYNQGVEDGVASCDLSGTDVEGKRETITLAQGNDFYSSPKLSRDGERIYHVPGQANYDRVDAEFLFETEEQAQAAGFRPSQS